TLASFSTMTGPGTAPASDAVRFTVSQPGKFGGLVIVVRSIDTLPGEPTPTPRTSRPGGSLASTCCTASTIRPSTRSGPRAACVSTCAWWMIVPSSSTSPALMLVPPRSMPTAYCCAIGMDSWDGERRGAAAALVAVGQVLDRVDRLAGAAHPVLLARDLLHDLVREPGADLPLEPVDLGLDRGVL